MKSTLIALVLCCTATAAAAQQSAAPTPAPPRGSTPSVVQTGQQAAPTPAPTQAPRLPSLAGPGNMPLPNATNIRLTLTITDTFDAPASKKTITLIVAQSFGGQIRSLAQFAGAATIDVDALATAYQSGLIATRITFNFQAAVPREGPLKDTRPAMINESFTVVLQDGKPMVVSESADPGSDRKVTVELTATILK